ncbi:hypothetical protein ACN4FE_04370 [Aliarcobacter butzleri]|uniref:hypothetical protein n=1 Tax=Aliarcobacter butzleri TaxID=28197 RepID=UPI003AF8FD46
MEEIKTVIDNTKDWYNLADTALKIGLGALIAGGFTYITTKANHTHENKKNQYELKKQLILKTSQLSSKYFSKVRHLYHLWNAPLTKNKFLKDLDEQLLKQYAKDNRIYVTGKKEIEKIDANLSLLGLEDLFSILVKYDNLIKKIRIEIFENKITFPGNNEDCVIELRKLKEEYNKALSKFFLNLKY